MTIASVRFKSYQEYLASDLAAEDNLRLLSNGDIIEGPPQGHFIPGNKGNANESRLLPPFQP